MDDDAKKTQSDLNLHIGDAKNIELVQEDLKRKARENAERVAMADMEKAQNEAAEKEQDAREVAGALHTDSPVKPLRTFQGDVADAIERQKTSLIKIKMAEEERRQAEEQENPHESGTRYGLRAIMLVLSIVLILIGGSIFAITKFLAKPAPLKPLTYDTLIPYTTSETVSVTGDGRTDLVDEFATLREKQIAPAAIDYLKLVDAAPTGQAAIGTSRFFSILSTKAPQQLIRAFSDTFMAGAYGTASPQPFLIIRIDSFDNAYRGMLEWENAMVEDIGPLFTSEQLGNLASGPAVTIPSTGTTTGFSGTDKGQDAFEDLVVNNRDTRAVRDEHGAVVFLYSFIDHNILLITTNEESFKGLIDKLIASKLIR